MASILGELDLKIRAKSNRNSPLARITDSPPPDWSISEQIIIRQLHAIEPRLDYVLFKQFDEEQPSQVAAVVIDNEAKMVMLPEASIKEIHRKLWLYGGGPLLYVGWNSKVDVFSCAAGPSFLNEQYKPTEIITAIADELIKLHCSERHLDGTFWDDPNTVAKFAKADESAHRILLEKIKELDNEIGGRRNKSARRLLLQVMLVKYLEDREVFNKSWFGRFRPGATSFLDLIELQDATVFYAFMEN